MPHRNKYYNQTSDIRAEVIVAMLLREHQIRDDQLVVKNKGNHKRSFSHDIHKIGGSRTILDGHHFQVQLNRDGIYDMIPEAFFHQKKQGAASSSPVQLMTEEYKRQKAEEKEARNFFAPIENEIFLQRVEIERKEVEVLSKLNQYDLSIPFFGLNSLDSSMPEELCRKWIALLPYVSDITGNSEQIRQCAEFFLEEKVQLLSLPSKQNQANSLSSKVGDCVLGGDMLLGDCFNPCFKHVELLIGPISPSKAIQYTPNQTYARFIDLFIEVFTPMSVDFTWRVEVMKTSDWVLGEDEYRLNFTTTI